jgi:AhpC/TSA family/Thiol:disulfide interchange protein DsbD, N-terminal
VAALSYDSTAVLSTFAARKGITYPLLSDPNSKVIRAFGILNINFKPGQLPYGVPFPGMYIIDEHGIVRGKYFEQDYAERDTASSVLVRQFGSEGVHKTEVETRHLKLISAASDTTVWPGSRLTLTLDLDLKPGMHVYAPGAQGGYIPIDWSMSAAKAWLSLPVVYPKSQRLNLPVIHEIVPVYQNHVRLTRDLVVAQSKPGDLTVTGSFRYQACDDRECYPPQTLPLEWTFQVQPLDRQRAPAALQRPSR